MFDDGIEIFMKNGTHIIIEMMIPLDLKPVDKDAEKTEYINEWLHENMNLDKISGWCWR